MTELTLRVNIFANEQLSAAMGRMQGFVKTNAERFKKIGQAATFAGGAIVGAATAAVVTATRFDSLNRGLAAAMGSAERAREEFKHLREVAKLPGLGLEEAIQGSINLQAVGFSAEQSRKILMGFGNALATVGRGKDDLDGVIVALTQMRSKGKVMAQEIYQIAERVPQIRKIMQEAFGTADTEAIQKMGVSPEEFINRVVAQLEKLPPVAGGAQLSFENLVDNIKILAVEIGGALLPALIAITNAIAPVVNLFATFAATPVGKAITIVTVSLGALAAAIGPFLMVLPQIVKTMELFGIGVQTVSSSATAAATAVKTLSAASAAASPGILSILGPVAAVAAAIGALVLSVRTAIAAYQAFQAMREARRKQAETRAAFEEVGATGYAPGEAIRLTHRPPGGKFNRALITGGRNQTVINIQHNSPLDVATRTRIARVVP